VHEGRPSRALTGRLRRPRAFGFDPVRGAAHPRGVIGSSSSREGALVDLRRKIGALAVDNFFRGLSAVGRMHPRARPARHGVEVTRDVAYLPDGRPEHRLDVYRPSAGTAPWPVVLYVHGGGFRILSKDTHWVMGLAFARRGYLVFNINYRLAPTHPFPAAVEDACAALTWVVENAASYGGDPSRLVLAGESAGGNLVTSLAVASSYARPEPFARAVFEAAQPRAVVAACGMLQVSEASRFGRRRKLPAFLRDRIAEVSSAYLEQADLSSPGAIDLADPLCLLERGGAPDRPLPAFFAPVGTRDPLLDDTRRLGAALERLGVPCETRYYPGEVHAFHALVMREQARRCWTDTFAFLDRHVGAP
jgi:acetyl esterase